jgi:DegV family protein with EDD domain
MPRIAVVTDSSAYLPDEMVREYGIHVIPLNVQFNGTTYKDLVDISVDEFYKKLAAAAELPSTSQPSAGEFVEVFKAAAKDHDAIIAVVLSSSLSGTYSSAMAAKDLLPDIDIAVVDSRSVSMGLGYMALAAARAARAGTSLPGIVAEVESMAPKMRVWFLVDTLKYLAKGGRIGGGEAFLGSMLSIKPLLQVENGKVEALDKVRTRGKAIERLVDRFKKECDGRPVHCTVINAVAPEEAEQLKNLVLTAFPQVQDLMITGVSAAIGTHVGPLALGLCFYTD